MKNKNLRNIFALALSTVLFVSVLTPAALAAEDSAAAESTEPAAVDAGRKGANRREELAEPENAIGRDAAIVKALAEAGVSADKAGDITVHVTRNSDGSIVYRVHFIVDGQRYSSEVDAVTGEILCSDVRDASDFDRGQGQNRRSDGQGQRRGGSQGQPKGGDRGGAPSPRGGRRDGSCLDQGGSTEA